MTMRCLISGVLDPRLMLGAARQPAAAPQTSRRVKIALHRFDLVRGGKPPYEWIAFRHARARAHLFLVAPCTQISRSRARHAGSDRTIRKSAGDDRDGVSEQSPKREYAPEKELARQGEPKGVERWCVVELEQLDA